MIGRKTGTRPRIVIATVTATEIETETGTEIVGTGETEIASGTEKESGSENANETAKETKDAGPGRRTRRTESQSLTRIGIASAIDEKEKYVIGEERGL